MKTKFFSLPLLVWCVATVTAAPPPGPPSAAAVAGEKGASRLLRLEAAPASRLEPQTFSSLDRPGRSAEAEVFARGALRFVDAELATVLNLYQELSGRTVVRPSILPAVKITAANQTPLTRREALQLLDTVLALNQIITIPTGTKLVKVVPAAQASGEAAPECNLPLDQLPESNSYLQYTVQLKHSDPREMLALLTPFARLPQSIVAMSGPRLLVLRDYSANVRRMLELIERSEKVKLPRPATGGKP